MSNVKIPSLLGDGAGVSPRFGFFGVAIFFLIFSFRTWDLPGTDLAGEDLVDVLGVDLTGDSSTDGALGLTGKKTFLKKN